MPNANFRNAFLVATFAILASGLAGCHLYLGDGDDDGTYCDQWGCSDDPADVGGGGWSCSDNQDCAAGCFCNDGGYCEEFGFCDTNTDCPSGFSCDGRSSCVPDGSSQPPTGGTPPPIERCEDTSDCSGDLECDYRGLCVPPDFNRPVFTCQSEVTCDETSPICPEGSTAAIEAGCYTGECVLDAECPDGAPIECSDLSESACVEDAACESVYRGVNCTSPSGDDCTSGSVNCTCESFLFDTCEEL